MLGMSAEQWDALLREECRQLEEEGREPRAVSRFCARAREAGPREELWEQAHDLPMRADWPYREPSSLGDIGDTLPPTPRLPVNREAWPQRIHGAWLGRCAGCMLGKPVEGWSREDLRALLEAAGEYPLRAYFPALPDPPPGVNSLPADSPLVRGNIARSERDDDTDYPVLNLLVWQRHGAAFTPQHVASAWLEYLPYHQVYTAERAAYRNLVCGVEPPDSALRWNPYREWIGAQIRADLWGYVTPARPALAAELAWRDASLSHTRNGIYGEIFFAALIAAALAVDDLETALEAALTTIPPLSRFAEMVADCREWHAGDADWEQSRDRVEAQYGRYHPVHTLNNAALVLLGLLYGGDDFSAVIGLAVQGGWDTDCNGATAGSVWGALHGAEAIPAAWRDPLHDTLISAVFGRGECHISGLAEETLEAALSLAEQTS